MPAYERSVFLNCPYDDQFAPLFHASVLTIAALGFTPRSARDTEGESDPRMERIARGLQQSKYSIHDLSRFQGEGPDHLSRFNMPLELGMALTLRYLGKNSGTTHNWVALVPEGFIHQKFISDLAGFDVPAHDQTQPGIIKAISGWLTIQPDYTPPTPTARAILQVFPGFAKLLDEAKADALGHLTWPAIIRCVERTLTAMADNPV